MKTARRYTAASARRLVTLLAFGLCLGPAWTGESAEEAGNQTKRTTLIVVVGAAGQAEYGQQFASWAERWRQAGERGGARCVMIGLDPTNQVNDLDRLKQTLAGEPADSLAELWLVLLGHGTFDGKEGKFNLRGPDLSASELANWLKPFSRPLAIINCASASAPFLSKLSATNRVVVSATRSGFEQNYARFGSYLAEAIADPAADLDKDGQTSLLEAFLMASRRVGEFYTTEGRLASEHALIDDNGDGLGTPADWFRGIRAVKRARDGAKLDGLRANQFHLVRSPQEQQLPPATRAQRDAIELAVVQLREQKGRMPEDEYYLQLEKLLIALAKLSAQKSAPNAE